MDKIRGGLLQIQKLVELVGGIILIAVFMCIFIPPWVMLCTKLGPLLNGPFSLLIALPLGAAMFAFGGAFFLGVMQWWERHCAKDYDLFWVKVEKACLKIEDEETAAHEPMLSRLLAKILRHITSAKIAAVIRVFCDPHKVANVAVNIRKWITRNRHLPWPQAAGRATILPLVGLAATSLLIALLSVVPAWPVVGAIIIVTIATLAVPFAGKPSSIKITSVALAGAVLVTVISAFQSKNVAEKVAEMFQNASWAGVAHLVHGDLFAFLLGVSVFMTLLDRTGVINSFAGIVARAAKGRPFAAMAYLFGGASFLAGIFDGVSLVGALLALSQAIAKMAKRESGLVMQLMAGVATTACGMWLAYGEPPNLIMKEALPNLLTDGFFLVYLAPIAAFGVGAVVWEIRKEFPGKSPLEMDTALAVPKNIWVAAGIGTALFLAGLLGHGAFHTPLLLAPWCAATAFGLTARSKSAEIAGKVWAHAKHEFGEYLFLLPFFLLVALFDALGGLNWVPGVVKGLLATGPFLSVCVVLLSMGVLSAFLDNNAVAIILGSTLATMAGAGADPNTVKLLAAAGLTGFALGGTMTPIGSVQSAMIWARMQADAMRTLGLPRVTWGGWAKATALPVIITALFAVVWLGIVMPLIR